MFKPDDEDKDLDLWLAEQTAAAAPVAAPVVPAPAPATPTQQDPLRNVLDQLVAEGTRTTNDHEQKYVRDLWNKAESQSLQKLTGDQSTENWAVGIGAALPMLAGILADATTKNAYGVRGTGLGQIAQAGAQHAGQMLTQQQQRKQQAQGLAEAAAGIRRQGANTKFDQLSTLAARLSDGERLKLAQGNYGIRTDESKLKATAEHRRGAESALKFDPADPQASATRELLYRYRPELVGQLDALGNEALKPYITKASDNANFRTELSQAIAKAGGTSAAAQQAQEDVIHGNAPVRTQDAVDRQEKLAEGQDTTQRKIVEKRATPPGFEISDANLYSDTRIDPQQEDKMKDFTQSGKTILDAQQKVAALRREHGANWTKSINRGDYEVLQQAVIGAFNRSIRDAGALNGGEYQVVQQTMPGFDPDKTDIVGWVTGSDRNAEQLEGALRGMSRIIDSRASSYGLRLKNTNAPARSAPPAQPTSNNSAPATGAASKWAKNKQ
jgi:hypothetical protein